MADKNLNLWENFFVQYRPFLVAFAFRVTGSLSEAEDIVQDTFIEAAKTSPSLILNPKSWLTKVCSNKSLDHLKSAYKKRETYPGTWLPDAIPESFGLWGDLSQSESPEKNLLISESLTISFLLLIERLTPEERVIYLLSEIFELSFKEISEYLGKSQDACRKIAQRAREGVASGKVKFKPGGSMAAQLIGRFFDSAKKGDRAALVELLSDNSELWSDGGGKVSAASAVFRDSAKIAAFFAGLGASPVFQSGEFKLEFGHVNSRPGLVISKRMPSGFWEFDTILSFEIDEGKIARIYAQRNPDKLKSLANLAHSTP